MKVHLVHAHPEPRSFTAAMRDVVIEELRATGHMVTHSDLYAIGFDPVLSDRDFCSRTKPEYLVYALEQRHSYAQGSLAPDIQREVEHVLAADVLGFTFPLFWFGVPAIMKGWTERVFLSGPFYGGKRLYAGGGLAGKRAFAAFSLGGREYMFGPDAIHGELAEGMMRNFFQGTLGYVGLAVHRPYIAYHVPYETSERREQMLCALREYIRGLDEQPVMPLPDLNRFDDVLRPR